MLKEPGHVDELLRDEDNLPELIPRLLAIGLTGFTIFGIAATVVLNLSGAAQSWVPKARWGDLSLANLILAYDLGLVTSPGVCLPSFYFFGLLAGLRISMLQVTAHAVKGLATSALVLVGILPIYVALALGMIVIDAPVEWRHLTLNLALPFIVGLWGVHSL